MLIYLEGDSDRTMVRAKNIIVDEGILQPSFIDDIPGDKEIIDPPPGVGFPGVEAV